MHAAISDGVEGVATRFGGSFPITETCELRSSVGRRCPSGLLWGLRDWG